MKRTGYILGIVLLSVLAAEKASALSYVIGPETRRQFEAELRTLEAQRQQTVNSINNLTRVLGSTQEMFVYSLNGSNRWEYWSTQQVAARLSQISGGQPRPYRAWWNHLLQQHYHYRNHVHRYEIPQHRQRLAQIDARIKYVRQILATNGAQPVNGGLTNVTVNTSPVHIKLWDHGIQDGDRVQLFVNGRFVKEVHLVKGAQTVTLPLQFGRHRLEVLALNKGTKGLNTASIRIEGVVRGRPKQDWKLDTGQRASMMITVGN